MGLHRQLLSSKLKPVLWLVVISALVAGSLLFYKWWMYGPTPSNISLEGKVESISVRWTDGTELEIDPSTDKGRGMVSICEGVLNRGLKQAPRGAELIYELIDKEDFERLRGSAPNVYLSLERKYGFEIYLSVGHPKEITADGFCFFLEKDESSVSWTERAFWVPKYPIDTGSRPYSELAGIFDIIPEEQAIAIAEGALTYWDEQSEAYRTITGEVDSVELCVYHYPVCTPPGKTPPPTLAYKVKFTLENNPHKNYLCENRWVAAKHAVVEVEAYTGKPLRVGYLNPCDP